MKLVCKCGNEMEFKVSDDQGENPYGYGNETLVETDSKKFDVWTNNDNLILVCQKCGYSVYSWV